MGEEFQNVSIPDELEAISIPKCLRIFPLQKDEEIGKKSLKFKPFL
jgi:hypothetical protein